MPRRALRPSLVVTFALSATAIAGGCGTSQSTGNPPPPPSDGGGYGGWCPAELPTQGAPCNLPISPTCSYGPCYEGNQTAVCEQGIWELGPCNPPAVNDSGPDVDDAGSDGEGHDGGHVADATGDVGPDAASE